MMLTKEQKWMNRLGRCLKDMPEGCEMLVNLAHHNQSNISLLKRGGFTESIEDAGCVIFGTGWSDKVVVDGGIFKNVIANSESI